MPSLITPNPNKLGKILYKHRLLLSATILLSLGGTALYSFSQPFLYESAASFLIESSDQERQNAVSILASTAVIEAAIPKIKSDHIQGIEKPNLVRQISRGLAIQPLERSQVLSITYSDRHPELAATILQALLDTYKAYGVTKSKQATQLIAAKIPDAKKQLEQSANALTRFRQQYNIIDPDTYAASVYTMKQGLESQTQDLQSRMAQSQRQLVELQRQVGRPADVAISGAILSQDSNYQILVKQFQEAQTNYFLERTRFQEAHPRVQSLKDRRDQIYALMRSQAEAILGARASDIDLTTEGTSSLKQDLITKLFETQTLVATQTAELGSLQASQAKVNQVFAQIPQLQQTYGELQRQFKQASEFLSQLNKQLEEKKILEAREVTSWQILATPSLPAAPVSPNLWLNFSLGSIAGILAGGIGLWILEKNDNRLQEVAQLGYISNLPILGAVPLLTIQAKLMAPSLPLASEQAFLPPSAHTGFTEAINSLALNIRNLAIQKSLKSIAFTSSIPSEGKSTLIYNLSLTLTNLGNRVLLVDGDMRRPTIHSLAGLTNHLGLSQAIATKLPWQQIIHTGDQSQFSEGYLHIITAGESHLNPMILLESQKFKKLLAEWRQIYDYVLIDTPPIVGITDAQSLAPKMDGVVLVTAIAKATKQAIARSLEILHINHSQVLGIAVNLVAKDDSTYCYDYCTSEYYNQSPRPLLGAARD